MTRWIILVCCTALAAVAQDPAPSPWTGLKYPALARSAVIHGRVEFAVDATGIHTIAGHPLLVPVAKSDLERWAKSRTLRTPLMVNYNFRLLPTRYVQVDEPIGDAFDRFFLRLFHLPVTRRFQRLVCNDPIDGPATFTTRMEQGTEIVEVDIAAETPCSYVIADPSPIDRTGF